MAHSTSIVMVWLILAVASTLAKAQSQIPQPAGFVGDLGLGVFSRQVIYRGDSVDSVVLPYVYGQYDRLFARVDTFGVKTAPVGYGHLEISARLLTDGTTKPSRSGLSERRASRPLGLSTFQTTPYGAVALSALHDFGDSGGNLIDVSWYGMFNIASWLKVFPQLGLEAMSSRYSNYYFGVHASETGYPAYRANATRNVYAALYTETPLPGQLALNLSFRQKWLGDEIADSPIVTSAHQWNAYAVVSYRFK